MKRAGALLLILVTLAFIASTMSYALHPAIGAATPTSEYSPEAIFGNYNDFLDLGDLFLRPRVLAMISLLALTWFSLAFHALRRFNEAFPRDADEASASLGLAEDMAEPALLITGIGAGAIWPWLRESYPVPSFLLCAVMLSGILCAALRVMRLGNSFRNSGALGFAAGWATLVTCATFATLLQTRLGAPTTLAASIAILIAALATVNVQLRLGPTISYSVAVIWGMIGLAAGSVAAEAALAMLAVLAIAVIAVALVRVTT